MNYRPARAIVLSAAFSIGTLTQAAAQTFEFSGDVSVGVNTLHKQYALARIDAIMAIRLIDLNESPVKAEIGTLGYFYRHDRPHETYAALSYDDRLRIGIMRPAYDLVIPSVFNFTAPSVAETRAEYTHALTTTEAMRFNSVPVGLSYSEDRGRYMWSVSAHDADDGDFRAASASVEIREANWSWAMAVEGVWDRQNRYKGANMKLGARWQQDQWQLGVAYLNPDANARTDTIALNAAYALTSDVGLSAFGEFTKGQVDDAYGLAGRYTLSPRSELNLSATHADDENLLNLTYTRRY